jgi:hypothetical protein
MFAAGRWRWLLDVSGSPAIPALLIEMASLGFNGLGPQMTGQQKAGSALVGWAFFGGFGALVLWFVWFFVRVLVLMCALGLGAVWLLYAPSASPQVGPTSVRQSPQLVIAGGEGFRCPVLAV